MSTLSYNCDNGMLICIMYEQFLIQAGLTKDQSVVYQTLMQGGLMPARVISQKTGLKRGLAYKVLEQLIEMGLTEKRENLGKITLFSPSHPGNIKKLMGQREQEMKNAEVSLDTVMGKMISDFNLVSGKPNVQFYEGMEGIMKVADDSLTSATEICEFIDNEAVQKFAPEINVEHVRKRRKEKIKKRMISVDGPFIRERAKSFDPETTEVRVISKDFGFTTVMQIYDDKISYATLDEKRRIGVIVEDPEIYRMHKTLFDYVWEQATPIFPVPVPGE